MFDFYLITRPKSILLPYFPRSSRKLCFPTFSRAALRMFLLSSVSAGGWVCRHDQRILKAPWYVLLSSPSRISASSSSGTSRALPRGSQSSPTFFANRRRRRLSKIPAPRNTKYKGFCQNSDNGVMLRLNSNFQRL